MINIIANTDPAGLLVFAAAALQTSAHIFKNQLILRATLLAGTFFYIGYYFVAADEPLWPAIFGSGAIALTSIVGYLRVLAAAIREQLEMRLYDLGDMNPRPHESACVLYGVRFV